MPRITILTPFLRICHELSKILILLVTVLYLSVWQQVSAQTVQDSLELGPIQVEATRVLQPLDRQPIRITLIDSTELKWAGQQTIAEVLGEHSTVDIKSYGPGGAATLSQRGLEADHTQVLWNGMPINTPFLGSTDLSLLDSDMISHIEVAPGNMSSSYGGRSLGGTILLDTNLPDNQIAASEAVGSFGYDRTLFKAGYENQGWNIGLIGRRQKASNNYTYLDPINNEIKERKNNSTRSRQFIAGISRDKTGGMDVSSMIWINQSRNDIPGPVVARTGSAHQKDRSLRWLAAAETFVSDWRFRLKTYYSSYELDYIDPPSDINSQTLSWQSRVHFDARKHYSDQLIVNASASGGLSGVKTNNYAGSVQRTLYSVQTNPLIIPTASLYIYPAVRFDYYSDYGGTLSPSLGINWQLPDQLIFHVNGGYNFSPPTFNDLYWSPGGNPNLKPERSKKIEAGFQWGNKSRLLGQHNLSAYYLHLNNGIQWLNQNGVWTPRNVKQMISRGVTWEMSKTVSLGSWNIRWKQLLDWTRAEITKSRSGQNSASGNQLAYVPHYKYKTNVSVQRKRLHTALHYQWTGVRFTDNSHQSHLDPYLLLNASLGYQYPLESLDIKGTLRVMNLTDTDYQMIQWYPMPGRHAQFTLTLHYNF